MAKLKTAVLGATGYSGLELARLLAHHSQIESPLLLRRSTETVDGQRLPFSIAGNTKGNWKRPFVDNRIFVVDLGATGRQFALLGDSARCVA